MHRGVVLLAICVLFPPSDALAQVRPYAMTLSPLLGRYLFEGNQGLKDSSVAGLAIGYNLSERLGAEGVLSFIDTTSSEPPVVDIQGYSLRLDLLYHFSPQRKFVPFLALGFGGVSLGPKGEDSDEDLQAGYGLGFKYFVTENLALRADGRHILHINFNDTDNSRSGHHNVLYSAGLSFQVGGLRKERQARVVDRIADGDGDGVPDHLDRCPHTPWGEVDAQGCPRDGDGDGVPDYLDACPATPRGQAVDARGCPSAPRP